MKDYYSLIMKLISFTNNDVTRYVDKNSDLKPLYLQHKDILDRFYKMCKTKNNR